MGIERIALVQILEFSKVQRDLSDTDIEQARWRRVTDTAFEALGCPSVADIAEIKREAAGQQSYSDLAASGGLVDAP